MTSTFTPNLALELPAHGDYASTGWDNPMDNTLNALDTAYGGYATVTMSGGIVQLTTAQASNPILLLSGTLSSDGYLCYPPIAGRRVLIVGVTLNGHALYVRGNNGTDGNGIYFWNGFGIPYPIVVTPSRVYWDYGGAQPGTITDMPTGFAGNGWLPCDGRWANMGLHDLLYYTIGGTWGISGSFPTGSFLLPDYRGTVTAMADQIGTVPGAGPFAVNNGSRGVLNNWGIAGFAGEANHQISVAEMPGHNHPGSYDSGHQHPGSYEDAHSHTLPWTALAPAGFGNYTGLPPVGQQGATSTSSVASTIHIANGNANLVVAAQGGWASHNNVQPTSTTMKMIKW